MFSRLDRIPACDEETDRQTNGRTSCHGIVRAMHTRRAVKIDDGFTTKFNLVHSLGILSVDYNVIA